MRWRLSSLARESLENVAANAIRASLLFVISGLLIGSIAYAELADVGDLRAFARDYREAGGFVAIARSERPFAAGPCAALAGHPDVLSSGAVLATSQQTFGSAPDSLFRTVTITEGILPVWSGSSAPAPSSAGSYIVGTAVASELGLKPGLHLLGPDGAIPVAQVIDTNRRNQEAVRAALTIAPPVGGTTECWAEFTPGAYEAGLAALPAVLATGDVEPNGIAYLRAGEFAVDLESELESRIQARGWPVVALLIAALFWIDAWFRRSEIGLYLAMSGGRSVVYVLVGVEALILIGASLVSGVTWAIAGQAIDSDVSWDAVRIAMQSALQVALLALVLAPLGGLLVARANIASLLKDR
jgi:hypothetical protein